MTRQLREIELFKNLDPIQIAHIEAITREKSLKKNEILFEEGDKAENFYVISEGRVRISKVIPGMGEEALAILNEGAYFGEMELIGPEMPRAAQATAHENCTLQTFSYVDFRELLNTDRELAVAILWGFCQTLALRLRAANDKVAATFAMAQFK